MSNKEKESKYLQYLPSIYQLGKEDISGAFLGRFLKAFEKILSGIDDGVKAGGQDIKGIEEILDDIHYYFDPFKVPTEFLQWLAGWVALTLKEDWNEENKRKLIARIVPLYKKRGTREGMEEYIRIYVGEDVKIFINEFLEPFQVGFTTTVGMNTVIGEGRPYFFHVYMELAAPDRALLEMKKSAIKEIIDKEKPAHTYYGLTIKVPTMQIGYFDPITGEPVGHSRVGVDTLLGGMIED